MGYVGAVMTFFSYLGLISTEVNHVLADPAHAAVFFHGYFAMGTHCTGVKCHNKHKDRNRLCNLPCHDKSSFWVSASNFASSIIRILCCTLNFYSFSLPIKKPVHRLSYDSGVPVSMLDYRL
jgi:hypothetical protein